MRIEATLPDSRGSAALELAEELGLTRSQLVDEALALFMKVVLEVKRGRRVMTVDPLRKEPDCELASPTLTTLEWAKSPPVNLSPAALEKMGQLIEHPPAPSQFLKDAEATHERRLAQADQPRRSGR
jgi:hypothetical protein